MKKTILSCFFFALFFLPAFAQTASRTYEFRNGNWYNGKDFTSGTWYVANGVLSKKAPLRIDTVIDLQGRWVTPPTGDAHCSSVADNPSAEKVLKLYAEEGAFYLQILSNSQEGRTAVQNWVNKAGAPEAIFANGGITCTLGYPFVKYEAPAQGIRNPRTIAERYDFIKQQRKMLGDGYWFVDSKETLDKNWEKIKAQKPGVISIYLLDSQNSGGKESKGLSPDVAKAVVKKARKAGLRVYAHVENADDIRLGIKLGVDGFANLPGHDWDGAGDTKKLELTDAELKQLAKKKIAVITVFSHAQAAGQRPAVQEFHAKTLQRLFGNNVNVVMGSDDSQRTIRTELNYWYTLGHIEYPKVLKTLVENTPRAIFPNRKVGKIEEGYEASFLVLSDNPLNNILKIRVAAFKMKNGVLMK